MAAQAATQEKENEVVAVRPTEENQEINPDREHQKNEADQENARSKKEEKKPQKEESQPLHILDIKV
jgi:hypothetical protein